MLGYVYCFSNDKMEGIYKIGLTTRTPLTRLREANMGDTWSLTSKFNIEFAKEVYDCHEKERQIHKHLSLIGERVFASKQSKERHGVTCRGNCIVSSVTVEQIYKIVDNRIKSMK